MWTSPDPWQCYECGREGIGGRAAGEHHQRTAHAPEPDKPRRAIVPVGVDARDVRTYGLEHGWKLGKRGRLPQALIDDYLASLKPRPTVDVEVVRELRGHGLTTAAIAQRLGVTEGAIEKAESRARSAS